ncbi:MAG: hypothetical protein ABSC48_03960 [Terracidiphilus sp.]|jgi:hypothetical protein
MLTPRAILAALLMAAPLLSGQPAGAQSPAVKDATHVIAPLRADGHRPLPHEPFQITIAFKRIYRGKLASDKTYSLAVTTNETLPAIRDDSRYRASVTDMNDILQGNTDVDILALKRSGQSMYIALKISTQTFGMDVPEELPKLPVAGTHQYILTPTVPIGQRRTIYLSTDAVHNTTVEVQILVQPFDEQQHLPQQP